MPPTWQDHLDEDRRLVILRLLSECGGTANEGVLRAGLEALGHRRGLTRDAVRALLDWLAERALVSLEYFDDRVAVATLIRRGLDCARGDIEVAGVKKPSIVG